MLSTTALASATMVDWLTRTSGAARPHASIDAKQQGFKDSPLPPCYARCSSLGRLAAFHTLRRNNWADNPSCGAIWRRCSRIALSQVARPSANPLSTQALGLQGRREDADAPVSMADATAAKGAMRKLHGRQRAAAAEMRCLFRRSFALL